MFETEITIKIRKEEFLSMVDFLAQVSFEAVEDLKCGHCRSSTSRLILLDYFLAKYYSRPVLISWQRKKDHQQYSLKLQLGLALTLFEELEKEHVTHQRWNLFTFKNKLSNKLLKLLNPSRLMIIN